ncbi:MAG: triose-phosphate isomerase [Planctomycetota bacterium]|nr:triose-phosphate isomerase [Planctomycetota bacterium]
MRKTLIAGNWKMNLDRTQAVALAMELESGFATDSDVELAVCPPFVYLDAVSAVVQATAIALGAQDMYFEKEGAFTGEVSGGMLTDLGCHYVILGHSERRHILGETDAVINQKVHAALALGLKPILCVGELLEEREASQTEAVVRQQMQGSLDGISADQMEDVVIAYEPVWAIGTGKVATPEQAQSVHADLRRMIEACYNPEVASKVRIQYGGSVKPGNAGELLSLPDVDGALVGGASLTASDFLGIVTAVTGT